MIREIGQVNEHKANASRELLQRMMNGNREPVIKLSGMMTGPVSGRFVGNRRTIGAYNRSKLGSGEYRSLHANKLKAEGTAVETPIVEKPISGYVSQSTKFTEPPKRNHNPFS